MSEATLIASWAGAGVLAGAVLAVPTRRLLTAAAPPGLTTAYLMVPLITAILFAALAWRIGGHFELLPFSVLAASGTALSLIDIVDQRLPSTIVYPTIVLVGALLGASAILHSNVTGFLRALAGTAILTTFYLALALLSGGGLGAGDVKLGGLLGLALGWLSWSALVTATFLGWFAAALVWLTLRVVRRRPRGSLLPMGPFLLLGAFVAVLAPIR